MERKKTKYSVKGRTLHGTVVLSTISCISLTGKTFVSKEIKSMALDAPLDPSSAWTPFHMKVLGHVNFIVTYDRDLRSRTFSSTILTAKERKFMRMPDVFRFFLT